jgi:outer membrane protein
MSLRTLRSTGAGAWLALVSAALAAPALAQGAGLKIAIIDVQRIITDSTTGKAALAELQKYGKDQQDRLEAKRQEIQQLRSRISDGQLSLAQDKLDQMQKDLETKGIELRRASDDAQRDFNSHQEQALKGIEDKVMPIIQQIGKEGGYTMIFRKFESGLVFADDGIDITAQVITRLDGPKPGG